MRVDGKDIVEAARAWKGTRFHHLGRSKDGIDCIGLLVVVAEDVGHPCGTAARCQLPAYGRIPRPDIIDPLLRRYFKKDEKNNLEPGDVLLFRIKAQPQHTAIYAERDGLPYMIHAYHPERRVVEQRLSPDWEAQIRSVWKWPEVEDI